MKLRTIIILAILVTSPCLAHPPARTNAETRESLRLFVQDFYDWYVPQFWKSSPKLAVSVALRHRSHLFQPGLAEALDAYAKLPGKHRRTLAGYRYDPFLNAGDACERYQAAPIISEGSDYQVSVYAICSGIVQGQPVVVAELAREGNHWVFANFRFPDDTDLLSYGRQSKDNSEALLRNQEK